MQELWEDLTGLSPFIGQLVLALAVLIGAVVTNRIIARFLRRAYWRRLDRAAEARGVAELTRVKRQRTLVTLLESLVRYGIYGAALVAIINVVRPGASSAIFSATLLGVLLGFGFQRLLGDVVAGALLLFEGQFAVGDVITVHTHNVTGTVEDFSLRTTTLRTAGDDRITLLNGSMVSITRWSYGQREWRLELLVRGSSGEERTGAVVEREASAAGALWVQPPMVQSIEPAGDDLRRIRIRTTVGPEHEAIVQRLARLLEAELVGDGLLVADEVLVLPLYAPTFETWRTSLLLRD